MTTVQAFWKRLRFRLSLQMGVSRIKRNLKAHPSRKSTAIAEALDNMSRRPSEAERLWIRKIEVERNRLLSSHEPLVDGTLGEGGLYDQGRTISDACLVSKSAEACGFLLALTRKLNPTLVIELGTNVGISSAYLASALEINGGDRLITTMDASPYRQRLAADVHRRTGLNRRVQYVEGLFTDTLKPTLSRMDAVDLAFIDGHHQYQPTLDYMEIILECASEDAALVFDDIRWSEGMRKAWDRIRHDERFGLVVDLHSMGICFRREDQQMPAIVGPVQLF